MQSSRVALGLSAALYFLLTVVLTWPLALHPGSRVPNDLGDSLLNMFLLAWNARQVPLTTEWWNLPQFFPIPGAMAFSEHLLGLAPITTPIILATGNVVLAYNAAFFLSFPLCALAAHLLAFQLTRRHDLALLAGIAYGFAPYRMAQLSHVQVLSSYWMPLSLLGLHLFLDRPRWWALVLFAGAWYMQALACGYYLFYLSALIGLWLLWFGLGRIRWQDTARLAVAWAVAVLALVPIALGYLRFQRAYGMRRWPDEIEAFSADVASLLTAPGNLRLWGWLNVIERPESNIFPGLALILVIAGGIALAWRAAASGAAQRLRATRLLLAGAVVFAAVAATPLWHGPLVIDIAGVRLLSVRTPQKPFSVAVLLAAVALVMHPSIRAGWQRRSALAFYTLAAVAMWLFALGPAPTFMGRPLLYKAPYAWLMLVPGVEGVRVPARFWVLATMCLAIAAALGTGYIAQALPRLRRAIVFAVIALLLLEAWPSGVALWAPPAFRPSAAGASARVELPIGPVHDLQALYRATEHRRPLLNGYSGYFAPHYHALLELLARRDPAVLPHLAPSGEVEVVVSHDGDADQAWRRFFSGQPRVRLTHQEPDYTVFRVSQGGAPLQTARFSSPPLRVATVAASAAGDRTGRMLDGDLITRWDTGGPQRPGHEVVIDLGDVRQVEGVEMIIAGYIADFPRALAVDLSPDQAAWSTVWEGEPVLLAYAAALESPGTIPLRLPAGNRPARYVRLRQTGAHPVYYWSIAELHVYGS